ncbi:ATP-dependent RNA helicase [Cyclobacterium amurskyense]|mgnify:FL=1|uniref:ATP-dependent RNA helicase n=2 Tax=Cyclobacterium amurskyense TaxID=320787 RepID=A0A0H4PIM2_9BACT|nr:ATP-dependent RNA helicase [Cyclobacterium amurskyense]|tara:strand:- start:406 stop:1725 length:1320 start_codon:yes stop_codon:yes gene_type:complete
MEMNKQTGSETFLKRLSLNSFNKMQLEFMEKAKAEAPLMLLAPTGSGKTLAFLIPMIQHLEVNDSSALIIVPSRELALQIMEVFKSLKTNFHACICYGGHSMKTEENRLNEKPQVIIGTPGRLSEHVQKGNLNDINISLVVLDEFDKSLQFGFHEQLRVIFERLSHEQKYFLTSATILENIPDFLPFKDYEKVSFLKEGEVMTLLLQLVRTSSVEKIDTLMRLVADFGQESTLVFCNHRDAVDRISLLLTDFGFQHAVLHGGLEQIDREKNLIKFRSGTHQLLIATDLASRGLDIPEIKHVVHYQLPPKKDAFIHRNGRTARMMAEGQSYLVLAHEESLPDYVDNNLPEYELRQDFKVPEPSNLTCVYISVGKKNKISKGDVVGFFTKKGGLKGSDIGMISILDNATYVAVPTDKVDDLFANTDGEKLKKLKVKMEVAN